MSQTITVTAPPITVTIPAQSFTVTIPDAGPPVVPPPGPGPTPPPEPDPVPPPVILPADKVVRTQADFNQLRTTQFQPGTTIYLKGGSYTADNEGFRGDDKNRLQAGSLAAGFGAL